MFAEQEEVLDHGSALGTASSLAALTFSSVYLIGEKVATLTKERPFLMGVLELYVFILSVAAFFSGLAVLAQIIAFIWPLSDSAWAIFARKLLKSAAYIVFVWGGFYGVVLSIGIGALVLAISFIPVSENTWHWNFLEIGSLVIMLAIGRFALAAFPLHEAEGLLDHNFTAVLGRWRATALLTLGCFCAIIFTVSRYQFEAHLGPSVASVESKIIEIRVTVSGVGTDHAAPEAHIRKIDDLKSHHAPTRVILVEEGHGSYVGWLETQALPTGIYLAEISPGFKQEPNSNRVEAWVDRVIMRRIGVKRCAFSVAAGV